ncbi:hypothetical protein TrCOL_g7427 [Triparma columacea]|uniref:Uncharacterized protein n=1 Tax=Triparma columacea TaxID=722753 RepID=A0A9W7GS21_9STRA|nr:hypothetical protein TrCOL_g7427 [Triparma columacea]
MEKATKFVDGLDKESNVADYDVVQGEVERQGGGSSGAKRGGELREYEKFLIEHDPKGAFANLMRVCDKDTGRAIWVTKESAEKIEDTSIGARRRSVVVGMNTGEGGGYEAKAAAEIKRLEEKNAKLFKEEMKRQLEIKKLEEKNMELMEMLKEMHLSSGESSVSSAGEKNLSSAAKLRQTVSAERDTEVGPSRDDGLIRKIEEMQRQFREELGNIGEMIGKVDEKIGKNEEKIGKGLAKVGKEGKVDDKMDEVVGAVKNAKLKKKGMFF